MAIDPWANPWGTICRSNLPLGFYPLRIVDNISLYIKQIWASSGCMIS